MMTSSWSFQCGGDNLFAEHGDVVLVRMPDLFEQTMGSELLEQA